MKKIMIFLFIMFITSLAAFDPPNNAVVDMDTGLMTWLPPLESIIADDFDSYQVDDFLTTQSDLWSTWNNLPGSGEDVYVTDENSYSDPNAIIIEYGNNILLDMDNYTSGLYVIEFSIFVSWNHYAYCGLQKTTTPGQECGLQMFFQAGSVQVDAGGTSAVTFLFDHGCWHDLFFAVDLDNDWCELYFNGQYIIGYQWSLGATGVPGLLQLGGLNFQGIGIPQFYIDDVNVKMLPSAESLIGYNAYLDGCLQNGTPITALEYQFTNMIPGLNHLAEVSAVYENPNGESDLITATPIWPSMFDPPQNLSAEVYEYNSVLLSWQLPERSTGHIPNFRHRNSQMLKYNYRSLSGYKIYQDDVEIATYPFPTVTEYLVEGLDAGDYEFYVTAVYQFPFGESEPSNIENVTITLPAPANVTATSYWPHILIEWDMPLDNRDIDFYSIYKDGTLAVVCSGYSTWYLFSDVLAGIYVYNVAAIYAGGFEGDWSTDVEIEHGYIGNDNILLLDSVLNNNYPNPFNPETEISFSVTQTSSFVTIEIFNLKGQKIKTLVNEILPAGNHSVIWHGTDDNEKSVSSGVYLYKMKSGNYQKTKKMILLR